MNKKLNKEILNVLNLSDNEIKVVDVCTNDSLKVSEIAQKTKIKRTNVYAITQKLTKNGLLVEISHEDYKNYRTVSLARIADLLDKNKDKNNKILESLNESIERLKNEYQVKRFPDIEYFNGYDEASKLYIKLRKVSGLDLISSFFRYVNAPDLIDKVITGIERDSENKEFNYGRQIVPDNEESFKIIKYQISRDSNYLKYHNFRFVNLQNFPAGVEIIIDKDAVYIFSFTDIETWAIRWKDISIVLAFKAMYEALWASGKTKNI